MRQRQPGTPRWSRECGLQRGCVLKTALRRHFHRLADHSREVWAKRRVEVFRRQQTSAPRTQHTLLWLLPGHQGIQRCPQRIDIRTPVGHPQAAILLRRRKTRCDRLRPHAGLQVRVIDFGNPEIHQHRLSLGCDANISRLDIPVDNRRFLGVQITQGIAYLLDPG